MHAWNASAAGVATQLSNPSSRLPQPMLVLLLLLLLSMPGPATCGVAPAVAARGRSTSVQSPVMASVEVRERRVGTFRCNGEEVGAEIGRRDAPRDADAIPQGLVAVLREQGAEEKDTIRGIRTAGRLGTEVDLPTRR